MNPILRGVLTIIAGFILGSIVNMGIISLSGIIIPPPPGTDVSNMESLKASMHLFEPKHFIMPFLAHAFGTLAGAYVAAKLTSRHELRIKMAMGVGLLFLIGGIINVFLLPAPMWYSVVDLVFAYIPMAFIGCKIAGPGKIMTEGSI
jgi:hypothetical protein